MAENNVGYGCLKVLKDVSDVYMRAAMLRHIVVVGAGAEIAGMGRRLKAVSCFRNEF